jgi:hypothetical protein
MQNHLLNLLFCFHTNILNFITMFFIQKQKIFMLLKIAITNKKGLISQGFLVNPKKFFNDC